MATGIQPLGDKVFIRLTEQSDVTEGGVHLPDSALKKPQEGYVVAIGRGRKFFDGSRNVLDVEVGERVLFSKHGGSVVFIDGEEFTVLDEDAIYAVLSVETSDTVLAPSGNPTKTLKFSLDLFDPSADIRRFIESSLKESGWRNAWSAIDPETRELCVYEFDDEPEPVVA